MDREAVLPSVLLPASQVLQDSVNLVFIADALEERQQVQELRVVHVVEPGLNWDLQTQSSPQVSVEHFALTAASLELTAFSG